MTNSVFQGRSLLAEKDFTKSEGFKEKRDSTSLSRR